MFLAVVLTVRADSSAGYRSDRASRSESATSMREVELSSKTR